MLETILRGWRESRPAVLKPVSTRVIKGFVVPFLHLNCGDMLAVQQFFQKLHGSQLCIHTSLVDEVPDEPRDMNDRLQPVKTEFFNFLNGPFPGVPHVYILTGVGAMWHEPCMRPFLGDLATLSVIARHFTNLGVNNIDLVLHSTEKNGGPRFEAINLRPAHSHLQYLQESFFRLPHRGRQTQSVPAAVGI